MAILTDLAKAFDCLHHNLMIAKLNCYAMETNSVRLIHSYLNGRCQSSGERSISEHLFEEGGISKEKCVEAASFDVAFLY